MANIPMEQQAKLDNILVTATFLSLAYVVLSGVGMYLVLTTTIFNSSV